MQPAPTAAPSSPVASPSEILRFSHYLSLQRDVPSVQAAINAVSVEFDRLRKKGVLEYFCDECKGAISRGV